MLASEQVIVQAPLSFSGSARRIWKLTRGKEGPALWLYGTLAVVLIALTWVVVAFWYLLWGVLLIPYRILRRSSRNRKRQELQHRETLAAIRRERAA